MDATNYQKLSSRTLIDKPGFEIPDKEIMAVWDVIGLTGEAGEVADEIKKDVTPVQPKPEASVEEIKEKIAEDEVVQKRIELWFNWSLKNNNKIFLIIFNLFF